MANFATNDSTAVFVGKDVAITASPADINGLADGEIRLYTPGGTLYTESAADANDEFVIVLGRTGEAPLVSTKIKKDWVTRISKKDYAADTQQVDYIGYTGSTGSIEVNNNTVYRARMNMIESPDTNHGGVYVKDLVYESDSSATQAEIAIGLAGSGVGNFSREPKNSSGDAQVTFKAICNEAASATNDFTNNVTITKGSKVFSVATALTYNGTTGTLAVGDFIRIASTLNGTLALTDSVYRVEAISGLFVTVDRPIIEPSGTWTDAGDGTQVITAATGAAADWGVAITGQDLDYKIGKLNDALVKWDLSLDSDAFGSTTLTNSAVAAFGTGTYNQVAELEWWANGNNGEFMRKGEPNIFSSTKMSVVGSTYDIITIEMEKGRNDSLGYVNSPQVIHIAVPAAETSGAWYAGDATDDTTDVLEDLLEGVPAYTTANSFDGTALTGGDLAAG